MGRLRTIQERNEAAIGFGVGRKRLVIVAWGPDIGVWQYDHPGTDVDMGALAPTPGAAARPAPPVAAVAADLPPPRVLRLPDATLSYRVPGGTGGPSDFRYMDRAVQRALYTARLNKSRCPAALVLSQWRVLLDKVPRWARKFLLSWTGPMTPRASGTLISDQGAESTPEAVTTQTPEFVVQLSDLGATEHRKAPQRFDASERVTAAQFLYRTGPDGRRLLIENKDGWLSLTRALHTIGREGALCDATHGLRAVLRRAFPKTRAHHRNQIAALLQGGSIPQSRLLFWLLAWGRLEVHDVPFLTEPVIKGISTACRDRKWGAWHRQPTQLLERAARTLLHWQRMDGVRDLARESPQSVERWAAYDHMLLGNHPLCRATTLIDAIHMASILDGLEEISRIESPARFLDYHRRCGHALGIKLSAELDPKLRFPAPPEPLRSLEGVHGGLVVTWLCTPSLMSLEGMRMRHCVGGASESAARGEWCFYHLELGDASATLQIRQNISQIRQNDPQPRRVNFQDCLIVDGGITEDVRVAPWATIAQLRTVLNRDPSVELLRALWAAFARLELIVTIPYDCINLVLDNGVDLWEHLPETTTGLLYRTWGDPRPSQARYRMRTHLLDPTVRRRYTVEELTALVYTPEPEPDFSATIRTAMINEQWAQVPVNAQIRGAHVVAPPLEAL